MRRETFGSASHTGGTMGRLILSINMSLDGFADHTLFAATADDELHDFFGGLLDVTDIALFGRVTYQLMEEYWPRAHEDPRATRSMLDFADKFNAIPKVVFSRTLQKAEWKNARLSTTNMVDEVASVPSRKSADIGARSWPRSIRPWRPTRRALPAGCRSIRTGRSWRSAP
jgi:dihydrofolate reductase